MADFFDEDPFESIFEEFFGKARPSRREAFARGESEERIIDVLEDEDYFYFVFELPGYEEGDVSISVKGRAIEIVIEKKNIDGIKEYLAQKLSAGIKYRKILPDYIHAKNFEYTLKNGILEIKFARKSR